MHRVDVTSSESGADHPERSPAVFKNTALDAGYNCGGIQRLICVNVSKVNDVLSRSLSPDRREVVLIIVNDSEYGGSGGAVAVASIHPDAVEIILHELGHSFGLLADEYGGPPPPSCVSNVEPPEANATKQTIRNLIKWNAWISPSTPLPTSGSAPGVPGIYPGARYCDTELFRPTFNSKMRSLGVPYEQINSEQLIKRIYNWASPLDGVEPANAQVFLARGASQTFQAHVPQPMTHALQIDWLVDGQPAGTGSTFVLSSSAAGSGAHRVDVVVSDPTTMVRQDSAGVLKESRTWEVVVGVSTGDFNGDGKADILWRHSSGTVYVWLMNGTTVIGAGSPGTACLRLDDRRRRRLQRRRQGRHPLAA